jgi:hypothetical protein
MATADGNLLNHLAHLPIAYQCYFHNSFSLNHLQKYSKTRTPQKNYTFFNISFQLEKASALQTSPCEPHNRCLGYKCAAVASFSK